MANYKEQYGLASSQDIIITYTNSDTDDRVDVELYDSTDPDEKYSVTHAYDTPVSDDDCGCECDQYLRPTLAQAKALAVELMSRGQAK